MNKQSLQQYIAIIREIEHLEAEKQRVIDRLFVRQPLDGLPRGGKTSDTVGEAVVRREHFQQIIDHKLDQLIELREEIEQAIGELPSLDRDLLRLRYIDGYSWEQIAIKLNYSIQHIWRCHGKILSKLG